MASVATLSEATIVGENEEQLVTMIVDNQLFGIPILQVQDIVEASKITPVPLAPSAIAGVLNLRGRIVTVIDLRKLLGNFEEVPWDSQMGVTVEHRGDLYTLLVDAIGDVRTLPKRDFDSAPSTLEDKFRHLCSGIFRLRGNLLVVLDVARILQPDTIEATPMITVEERRTRKQAAQDESDGEKADKNRQLSQLMTDLNGYETDFESGLESLSGDSDDIKSRKKANRNRRPVGERWREVLEEKARRDGTTVYRMREPDEETLEQAREEASNQEDGWEAEWRARQDGTHESRLDQDEEQAAAEQMPVTGDFDQAAQEPAHGDADEAANSGSGVFDWWNKMRGKAKPADETSDSPAEEAVTEDLPPADAVPEDLPPVDSATEELPPADEAPEIEDATEKAAEEPAAPEDTAADESPDSETGSEDKPTKGSSAKSSKKKTSSSTRSSSKAKKKK